MGDESLHHRRAMVPHTGIDPGRTACTASCTTDAWSSTFWLDSLASSQFKLHSSHSSKLPYIGRAILLLELLPAKSMAMVS